MRKILVIGATSAIAEATARIWAQRGDELFLVARNEESLNLMTKDLKVRGSSGIIKRGTMVKHIRLTDAADEIEGKVDKSVMVLRTEFLKKA